RLPVSDQPSLPLNGQDAYIPIRLRPTDKPWSVRLNARVMVRNHPPYRYFLVEGQLFYPARLNRPQEERLALILLCVAGHATPQEIAATYGYHVRTIYQWVQQYHEASLPAVVGQRHLRTLDGLTVTEPSPAEAPTETPPVTPPESKPEEASLFPEASAAEPPAQVAFSRYAGLYVALPFLQQGLEPVWAYVAEHDPSAPGQEVRALLLAMAWMDLAGVRHPEQLKPMAAQEWQALGLPWPLTCAAVRRRLPLLEEEGLATSFPTLLCGRLIELGWVQLGTFYLDGHFIPYWGGAKLPKGYFPQRKLAMKGLSTYWVHDGKGRPVYFWITPPFVVFVRFLPHMMEEARRWMQAEGLEGPPVFVFDRGGCSKEIFLYCDRMAAGWITYRKRAKEYPVELFTEELELTYEDGHAYRTQWLQTYTAVKGYQEQVYTIALRDPETGRQAEIITNLDRVCPDYADPPWIIQAIKSRWRQENMFKWGQARCGLNHLWAWSEIEPLDDVQAQLPNPAYERLARRLRNV
ncbi:MAG: helix-turn-helix domain-containing protein, partial [Limnochordaceae bacterium]|nr:helix-turn-helix domain-containing protein [Limnochordaceae bacterium]